MFLNKKIFALAFLLALTGCGKKQDNKQPECEVYYDVVDDNMKTVWYSTEYYYYSKLHFDDNYYTSLDITDEGVKNLSSLKGDKLGSVYGNHKIRWATKEDELNEVTNYGDIYSIKGFEDKNVVLLEYMSDESSKSEYIVFQCLTKIGLDKGKDLFIDKMMLDKAAKLEMDEGGHVLSIDKYEYTIDTGSDSYKNFITAISNATMISPAGKVFRFDYPESTGHPIIADIPVDGQTTPDASEISEESKHYYEVFNSAKYAIRITNEYGIMYDLTIHPEGYVTYQNDGNYYIVQIDENVINSLFGDVPFVTRSVPLSRGSDETIEII